VMKVIRYARFVGQREIILELAEQIK
jgi:hypothetical protein